jgi:transporter family protein
MNWILAAGLSALFAGLVSILAKLGVRTTDSDVATALRTIVVLVFAWIAATLAGRLNTIATLSPTTWVFLVLSGLATGGSWICYFKALSQGDVNKVVPIDKSSAVLASLLAIVLFAETHHLAVKLVCIAGILVGTYLMIERKQPSGSTSQSNAWLVYAILSAVFAALTSILGKVGIDGVESNLGTAIRTTVVLAMAWLIVAWKGKLPLVHTVDAGEGLFLALSGVATGASWLLYYYAIQTGVVSVVVQIDKLSILVSVGFASLVLKEHLTPKAAGGLVLITAGTALMCVFS